MVAAVLTSDLLLPKGAAMPSCIDERQLPPYGAPRPVTASVAGQQGESHEGGGGAPRAARPSGPAARGGDARARMSVRLDAERHLRLRLLAAHMQAHIQDILVEAIDDYVAKVAPCLGLDACQCLTEEDGSGPKVTRRESA